MLRKKVKHHLLKYRESPEGAQEDILRARLYRCFTQWWTRGLHFQPGMKPEESISTVKRVAAFKSLLWWDEDALDRWFDDGLNSLLVYACIANNFSIVRILLDEIATIPSAVERARRIDGSCRRKGFVEFGIPGEASALQAAMAFASSDIVELLLSHGANPENFDSMGSDPLMIAATMSRLQNITTWLEQIPSWDVNRGNKVNGGVALAYAALLGRKNLSIIRRLVEAGADIRKLNAFGGSVLYACCANPDADPKVAEYLLDVLDRTKRKWKRRMRERDAASCCLCAAPSISRRAGGGVNYQRCAQTFKARSIHRLFLFLYKSGISRSAIATMLSQEQDETALHQAVQHGHVAIVQMLIARGANPRLRSALGDDAFDIAKKSGVTKEIMSALEQLNEPKESTGR
eukprot:g3105.t1